MSKHSFDVAKLAKEKGNEAFECKDYATARLLYSQAMKIDPSQYIYPLNSAIANLKLERWLDAESSATTALELAPDSLKALFRRGLARTELRQWSQARQDIQAFLDHGGSSVEGHAALDAITHSEAASTPDSISDGSNDRCELFEKNPPDDVPPGLAIRDSKIDGKGVFATREFKRGETILCENPLLTVATAVKDSGVHAYVEAALLKMSPENMARFLSLHNMHTGTCCTGRLPHHASEIFDSNMIMPTDSSALKGVCYHLSLSNHSCIPNANYKFDPTTGEFQMYAVGLIREGEEIFSMYGAYGHDMYFMPRGERQALLNKQYHFTCACAVCTLADTTAVKASDARRMRITEIGDHMELPAVYPRHFALSDLSEETLRGFIEVSRVLLEEGIRDCAVEFTAFAMLACVQLSDLASAKYWAEVIYQTTVDQFGEGSKEAQEVRETCLFQPTRLPMAELVSEVRRIVARLNSGV